MIDLDSRILADLTYAVIEARARVSELATAPDDRFLAALSALREAEARLEAFESA